MIITTIHKRGAERYRQSVDIKKNIISELEYLVQLLNDTTAMGDKATSQVNKVRCSILECIENIAGSE